MFHITLVPALLLAEVAGPILAAQTEDVWKFPIVCKACKSLLLQIYSFKQQLCLRCAEGRCGFIWTVGGAGAQVSQVAHMNGERT